MINILINRDLLKDFIDTKTYSYVEFPFRRCETVIAFKGITDEIKNIINTIDGCKLDEANNVISKFTNTPISMDNISDGAKTAIYVYFRTQVLSDKEIIDITNCGPNAIEYILKNYSKADLTLFLGHLEIPEGITCDFKLNGNLMHGTSEIFK